jgi:hypothetical protein
LTKGKRRLNKLKFSDHDCPEKISQHEYHLKAFASIGRFQGVSGGRNMPCCFTENQIVNGQGLHYRPLENAPLKTKGETSVTPERKGVFAREQRKTG